MIVEFQFHGATAPTGLASTHTVEALPQKGDTVTFADGSRWAVSEIVHDIRESTTATVVRVGPYAEFRSAR
ncbi:MAG: hypothetical protein J0M24_19775 [Verrucomicrobia bacterium]|nr:hypothetical protein [Verrucomicrobiota bacterium]